MGCGSSKPPAQPRNDDPPIDAIDVADLDPNYPPPRPPDNSKDDIYNPAEYTDVDRKANQLAKTKYQTYEALIDALTAGLSTDLQKVRAIFIWLFHQDIYGSFYNGVVDPYTPNGYMKLMKCRKGSYASFFAQLCRAADIPCNVIRGVAKSDKYEVGQQEMTGLDGAWNAVYIGGSWRFIHPLWSYFKEKANYEEGQPPVAGAKRPSAHDFFWLTDPTKMICFCRSNSDPWQLLKSAWQLKKFTNSPQFTEDYFTCGLMLPRKYNAIIPSDNGICTIDFDHQEYEEFCLDANVNFDPEMSEDKLPADVNMRDYVVTSSTSSSRKSVIIRLPAPGRYAVDVFGTKGANTQNQLPKIVEFRVECSDVMNDPQRFPLNPTEGFGLLSTASQYGISDPVPDSGLVLVKAGQQRTFSFMSSQKVDVESTLVHVQTHPKDFEDFITTRSEGENVRVELVVPDEKNLEFAFQIAVRPQNSAQPFKTIANYLLVDENWKKKTAVVPPNPVNSKDEDRVRKELVSATHKNDIAKLENAIAEFEHLGLSDNGDLTRARHKLLLLHLENLRATTKDRKLDPLDKAIDAAKKSHVAVDLIETKEMADAEATRRQLRRLRLYMHKVLELNKPTISEIHSYQRPKPLVHTVMKATLRILGEPRKKVQDWSFIQTSMRRLGRESIINRIRNFDVITVQEPQIDDAERYLKPTNKYLVRMCSAGAGTFYVWSNNMISEFQGKGEIDPLKIWGKPNKNDSKKTNQGEKNIGNGGDGSSRRGSPVRDSPTYKKDDRAGDSSPDHGGKPEGSRYSDTWNPNASSGTGNNMRSP